MLNSWSLYKSPLLYSPPLTYRCKNLCLSGGGWGQNSPFSSRNHISEINTGYGRSYTYRITTRIFKNRCVRILTNTIIIIVHAQRATYGVPPHWVTINTTSDWSRQPTVMAGVSVHIDLKWCFAPVSGPTWGEISCAGVGNSASTIGILLVVLTRAQEEWVAVDEVTGVTRKPYRPWMITRSHKQQTRVPGGDVVIPP